MKTLPLQSDYRVGCRTYICKLVTACFVAMLFFGGAEIATAAIGYVNGSNVLASTANNIAGSPYTSGTYTPTSDANVLVIFVQGYNALGSDTASISSITWGGVSIAGNQQAFRNATTRAWSAVYVITNPGTTAKAVQVALGVDQRALQIDILEFSGVDTVTPVVSTTQVGGTAISDTLDFTVSDAGNVIVGSFSVDGGAVTPFTPDSGTIEVTDQATGGTSFNDNSVSSFYKITTGSGAQSIGTTWALSASYAGTGVELAASSGGGGSGGDEVKLSGTLYESDGTTPIVTTATVTVAIATSTPSLHSTSTDGSGNFSIVLPEYQIATTSPWATTTAADDDDFWRSVTYGNGLFVAVAACSFGGDCVMYSADGITWATTTAAGNNDEWNSITYGNGLFVAVAGTFGNDRVMTSPDGITWTAQSAVGNNDRWQGVTYKNGLFVAVGEGGSGRDVVMTSPDGINWTAQSAAGNDDFWQSVTYGNGLFVAVGEGGSGRDVVMTSPDGINWTARSTPGDNDEWRSVTYGNGLFVTVGAGYIDHYVMTSPDGINWTGRLATGNDLEWSEVFFADGLFVLVSYGVDFGGEFATSVDGINWTTLSVAGNNDNWDGITSGNGRFVVVGSGPDRVVSADFTPAFNETVPLTLFVDGATTSKATTLTYLNGSTTITGIDLWQDTVRLQHSSTTGVIDLASVDFYDASDNPDILVDVSGGTTTVGSGISFADLRIEPGTTFIPTSELVVRGSLIQNGSFRAGLGTTTLAGGNATATGTLTGLDALGNVKVSPSSLGQVWATTTAAGNDDFWQDIVYGNGQFVAVGQLGDRVMTSPDGITWTTQSAAGNNDSWQSVTYGDGLFVAVGEGPTNYVMTSPDGIDWTVRTAPSATDDWHGVTYGDGLFVAVGEGPTNYVMTSPDGIDWTPYSAAGDNDSWQDIVYGNGLFVAVGNSGDRVMTSPNGITWTAQTAIIGTWQNVAYGNNLFVAVSGAGSNQIMTSPDGFVWTDADEGLVSSRAVTFANGVFVIVGTNPLSSNDVVRTSPNGSGWTDYEATGSNTIWTSVASNGNTFVTLATFSAEPQRVMYSTDGLYTIGTASTSHIVIEANKELISNGTIDVSQQLINAGTLTNNGLLRFTETSELVIEDGANSVIGDVEVIGTVIFNNSATTSTLTITSSGDLTIEEALEVHGDFIQNGSIDLSTKTLYFSTGNSSVSGSLTGVNALGNVVVGVPGVSGGGDETITLTAGEFVNGDTFYGYIEGFTGSLENNSSLSVNAIVTTNLGDWIGFLQVPDTVPSLTLISIDGVSYELTFDSSADGFDTYTFDPGAQIFTSGLSYNITVTDGSDNIYGGVTIGTVTFVDSAEVTDLDIETNTILKIDDTLIIAGDYTNNGQLNASTSEVIFDGVTIQTATGTLSATSSFYDLRISNTSQDGDGAQSVIFGAPLTVTNTYTMLPGTSASFLAAATSTLQNIDLQGTGGNEIYLRSTAGGTTWGLDVPGSQINVSFVDVQDSYSSTTITASSSIDSGNNNNWFFVGGEVVVGSSTIANHDEGRVSNAFNFQNKTNESLYTFKLIPESGTATVTSVTLNLSGVEDVDVNDFSNISLMRGDAATVEVLDDTGVMIIDAVTETGTIVFSSDFSINSADNYLVTANWNAPERGAVMNIQLLPSGVLIIDTNGSQDVFGSVSLVQHSRLENRGGGGGRASDIGGAPPEGDGIVTGGGAGPGEQIGNNPNFRRPSAHAGTWSDGQNAYDQTDGTYATTNTAQQGSWRDHQFLINAGNSITGIEVRLEQAANFAQGNLAIELSWNGGTSWTSQKLTPNFMLSDAVVTVGGSSDLWSRVWAPQDFSEENFRIRLQPTNLVEGPATTVRVDEIQVRVYNQASGGGSGGGTDI